MLKVNTFSVSNFLEVLCCSFQVYAHSETLQSSLTASLKSLSPCRDPDRSTSPTAKRDSPVTVRDPPKYSRLSPSPTPSISPLIKKRRAEAGRTSPSLKVNIPTIIVKDEFMETESATDGSNEASKARRKESRVWKGKKSRSTQEGTRYFISFTGNCICKS